jgi:murein DD-endopeptidase MepM/ murein hydrolase activator NlpD
MASHPPDLSLRDGVGGVETPGVMAIRRPPSFRLLACLLIWCCCLSPAMSAVRVAIADGFDFPVGIPNADGYYKARGLRLRPPVHFGEDWNGRGGGDTDLGDPVYAMGNGMVVFAFDVRVGWGNVVIIRHAYRDPATGKVNYCDSLYGHLHQMMVKVGQEVKRGQQVGTIGSNRGMYPAHLHFEVRHNLAIGMQRESVERNMVNWADPTQFINRYRRLNREWGKQTIPTGTFQEYHGFKGL